MRQKRTAGYAERLRWAMERGPKPMSARALARALEGSGIRGTSYGGVRQYVEGKVRNPRVELLRAFADQLGVRGDWLAFGEGEPTEAAQRRREMQEGALTGEDAWEWLTKRISLVFPEYEAFRPAAKALVIDAIDHFFQALPPEAHDEDGRVKPDIYDAFLDWLRQSVLGPLLAWGPRDDFSSRRIHEYILSALALAIQAIPEQVAGAPRYVRLVVEGEQHGEEA